MKKYLYGEEKETIVISKDDIIIPSNNENKELKNEEEIKSSNKTEGEDKITVLPRDIQDEQMSIIMPNSYELIKKETNSIFIRINIRQLKKDNPRAIGIQDLCYEIQQMCFNMHNKKYCIAFPFLLRSLLEQSSIYFLINKNRWEKLKEGNANKDLKLEQIIREIERNKSRYFDKNTLRCWDAFNNNTSTKDYFDMIFHHPYFYKL